MKRRLVVMLMLPLIVFLWIVGWSLTCISDSHVGAIHGREEQKKHRSDVDGHGHSTEEFATLLLEEEQVVQ